MSLLSTASKIQKLLVTGLLHKLLIPLVLTLIYLFVVGPMSLLWRVLGRRDQRAKPLSPDSYWIQASGYELDPSKIGRQS